MEREQSISGFTIHTLSSSIPNLRFRYLFFSKFSTCNSFSGWEVLMGPNMVLTPMRPWRGSLTGPPRNSAFPSLVLVGSLLPTLLDVSRVKAITSLLLTGRRTNT
ncbi:hypothetical protein V6N13_137483 [Hibiscus sabdariffa]